jgi:uncharacterized protein involved in exopolysaccharide biosynthesis
MNAPSPSLFPKHALWLTIAGVLFGGLAAVYINMAEKRQFESHTVCRPVRPATDVSGISHREWLNTEAAAMGSNENLLRVTRNLNLDSEWNLSATECVEALKGMVKVETIPDSALIRVIARSMKTVEAAALVNAVVVARDEFYQDKRDREKNIEQAVRSGRVDALNTSSARKRRALLDGLEAARLLPENANDESLKELTLPKPLESLRNEWIAEAARLEEAKRISESVAASGSNKAYAEILERGMPSLNPVDPGIQARITKWTISGAGVGLLLSYILGRFSSRTSDEAPPREQAPIPTGEY